MKSSDIKRHELIGLDIEVIDAKNKSLIGIKGRIVDETRNTIKVIHENQEKILLKDQITFITKFNGQKIKINSKLFAGKPEERIKK